MDLSQQYGSQRSSPSTVPFKDFLSYALARWPALGAAVILGVVASLALSAFSDPMYRSSETVVVGPGFDSPAVESRDLQASERIAATYASLAKDGQFLADIIDTLNLDVSPGELAERVELTVIPTTQLLTVSSVAETAEEAEAVTDAVSRKLVAVASGQESSNGSDDPIHERVESLESRIATTESRISRLGFELEVQTSLEDCLGEQQNVDACQVQQEIRDLLQQELQRQETLLGTLESNYILALDLAKGAENAPGRVTRLGDGAGEAKPVTLGTALSVLAGVFAGLMLATVILYLGWSARARRRNLVGIPSVTIDHFDLLRAAEGRLSPQDTAARRLDSLESRWILDGDFVPQSVAVLAGSPESGEIAQHYALHLARKLAGEGVKTVLIDGVFASPQLHQATGTTLFPGLAELLTGSIRSLDVAVQHTDVPGLSLVAAGWLDEPPERGSLPHRLQDLARDLNRSAEAVVAALSFGDRDRVSKELARWFRSSVVVVAEADSRPSSRAVVQSTKPIIPNVLYVVEVEGVGSRAPSLDRDEETV